MQAFFHVPRHPGAREIIPPWETHEAHMGHKARESEKNAITVAYCLRFDSRPRMGSDRHRRVAYGQPLRFNSRSRMGSDQIQGRRYPEAEVSIHAPAWGATCRGG